MHKSVFLSKGYVPAFVEWMSANLDSATFEHCYLDRRTMMQWQCNNLYDAYAKYHWKHPAIPRLGVAAGHDFQSNNAALTALAYDLNSALVLINDADVYTATADVMTWGGVRAGNIRWLDANQVGLTQLIASTSTVLNSGTTNNPVLQASSLRFNSGMTKVYSLTCKDFIIFDSRVAAALGWAVVKFCDECGLVSLPPELCFPWAPAKESYRQQIPKERNPSRGLLRFPRLVSGPIHAEWNLKASWILSDVLNHPNASRSKFSGIASINDRLRALEAALFMIGYDLSGEAAVATATNTTNGNLKNGNSFDQTGVCESDEWIDCVTLSKKKDFRYRITADGVEIEDGPVFRDTDINATIAELFTDFGTADFPLANSATEVRNGTSPNGLGACYFKVTQNNPPDTSKLAAVLEEVGVIVRAKSAQSRGLHWRLETDRLRSSESSGRFDVRRALDDFLDVFSDV